MQKIRKGDEIIVITGKDRGKRGKVLHVLKEAGRLIVEGVNVSKKHIKPNPNTNTRGGIVDREAPIHISNVAVFNTAKGNADRVKIKILGDGTRTRVFKSNDEAVDI